MAPVVLAALIQAAGVAANAVASHNANKKSAQANEQANNLIAEQKSQNASWWNTKKNEDYTQRADAQAAINRQRELLNDHYKTVQATNNVAGGTEYQEAIQKESANKSVSDTITNIAEAGANAKDAAEQQYRQTDANLTQQQVAVKQGQAQNIANTGAQTVNAITGATGAITGNAELMQQGADLINGMGGNIQARGKANANAVTDDLDDLLSGFNGRKSRN